MYPCFIFGKDPQTRTLSTDRQKIAQFASDWHATHIIGGAVVAHKNGYTGRMVITDPSGKSILSKQYAVPLPYFTLMGRMVEDWMTFRGQACSADLKAELERPMTQHPELVTLYGTAFDKPWHSPDESAVYQQILQADPSFGEVRWYLANQQMWIKGQTPELDAEIARSFLDHPVIPALSGYNVTAFPDANLKPRADAAFDKALEMEPDHCQLLARVQYWDHGNDAFWTEHPPVTPGHPSKTIESELIPLAQKYTCAIQFLDRLAEGFMVRQQVDRSIAIDLSAINSGMLPGNGSVGQQWYRAGVGYWTLGHPNAALSCFVNAMHNPGNQQTMLLSAQATLGLLRDYFDDNSALDLAKKLMDDTDDPIIFVEGFLSACESGDLTQANSWRKKINALADNNQKRLCNAAYNTFSHLDGDATSPYQLYNNLSDHLSIEMTQYSNNDTQADNMYGFPSTVTDLL